MPIRLAPKSPEIGNLDGFDKHDLFHAKRMGERLADIVCDLEGPAVIAIDGSWGTRKTTFVRQWAGLLREKRHPVVYFDAFEHDHLDDPFMALFTHLLMARAKSDQPILAMHKDKLIDTIAPLVKPALVSVAGGILKHASMGVIDIKNIWRLARWRKRESQYPAHRITQAVERIARQAARVDAFRKSLSGCVSQLGQSNETDSESGAIAPLVFIVDELDRCRPSYALSLLERIKHVFSTDNVCFVLVTNVDSLAEMAEKTYGFKNGRDYLQKFYHRRIDIRAVLRHRARSAGAAYLSHLAAQRNMMWDSERYDKVVLEDLIRVHDVPLRRQERIMASFQLLYQYKGGHIEYQIMAASLCVMRSIQPDLFDAARRGPIPYSDIEQFLGFDDQWREAEKVEKCWREFAGETAEQGQYSWGYMQPVSEEEYRGYIAKICDTIELFQPLAS